MERQEEGRLRCFRHAALDRYVRVVEAGEDHGDGEARGELHREPARDLQHHVLLDDPPDAGSPRIVSAMTRVDDDHRESLVAWAPAVEPSRRSGGRRVGRRSVDGSDRRLGGAAGRLDGGDGRLGCGSRSHGARLGRLLASRSGGFRPAPWRRLHGRGCLCWRGRLCRGGGRRRLRLSSGWRRAWLR